MEASSPEPALGTGPELRVHAWTLAYLFAVGATLVVLTGGFHRKAGQDEIALLLLAGGCYLAAAVLRAGYRWLPAWTFHAFVVLGTVLITFGIDFAGDGASAYAVFYFWIAIYSFYFFTRVQAIAHMSLVAVAYALVLWLGPASSAPAARWVLTIGTMAVASFLVAGLVAAVRERAAELGHRADRLREAEARTRADAQDLTRVADMARDLAGVSDAHAARPAICKAARELSGAKVAILYEPDAKGQKLVSTAVVGAKVAQIHLPFAGGPSGATTAFASAQPYFVADLVHHGGVAQPVREKLGVVSALWQPVLRNDVPIGVLTLAWDEPVEDPGERVRSLVGLLAAEASVAIERADLLARLETVARTDDLTGLANRRAWEEHLPRELARAKREGRPLCVAMLDLDRFKAYNDARGHQAGDRLLKQVAATWREMLRPSDLLARYGGEEFGLVLPHCTLELGLEVVERLRKYTVAGQTCSAGVAMWDGKETPDHLVQRADAALYDAKNAGRDKAVAAG
jgi:diguanylate cyclase (GGDEF)-like protein